MPAVAHARQITNLTPRAVGGDKRRVHLRIAQIVGLVAANEHQFGALGLGHDQVIKRQGPAVNRVIHLIQRVRPLRPDIVGGRGPGAAQRAVSRRDVKLNDGFVCLRRDHRRPGPISRQRIAVGAIIHHRQ